MEKKDLNQENVEALLKGITNLEKHIENIGKYNLPYVVAINRFNSDTDAEVKALHDWAVKHNHPVALSEVFAKGGEGGIELAKKLVEVIETRDGSKNFKPIYEDNLSVEEKIETICKEIYGADVVDYGEYVLGTRNEGVIFSLQTLIVKFTAALTSLSIGFVLELTGYVPNAVQSLGTQNSIRILMCLIPAIGVVLAYVVYKKKYKLDDAFMKTVVEKNAETNAERYEEELERTVYVDSEQTFVPGVLVESV